MIHKHSITKNILDATPVILGAAQGSDMVTFAYGSLTKALNRTQSGEIEFGYDEATGGGQILVGGTPVTSKILDITSVQKANASTGVKTITFTYVDPEQKAGTGKSTSTFEVVDEAAAKSFVTDLSTALIGAANDASSLDTINAAKNYAKAAGWTIAYDNTTDSNNPVIQLKSQGGTVISSISAKAFIKDGMLNSATLVTEKTGEAAGSGPWIKLTWNTDAGKEDTYINVHSLVDTYTTDRTDQLSISGYKINPITADPADLTTGTLDSSALATAGQVKAYVDAKVSDKNVSATGETGDSALVTASANNNAVTVGSTTKLQTAVDLAETAVQTISEGSSTESYVALTVGTKTDRAVAISISDAALVTKINAMDVSINNNNASIVSLNTSVNGLETKVNGGLSTDNADTYVNVAIDSTNKFKIDVTSKEPLITAVANANSAVQNGSVGTNAKGFLTNSKGTAGTADSSNLIVNFVNAPINTSANLGDLGSGEGTTTLVTARAIKDFVDSKTSAALSWIMLDPQS